ncbi:hypothetical protein ACFOSW_14155 [Paenibacillus sp. GCM10012303]|jgi:hypothetical protein
MNRMAEYKSGENEYNGECRKPRGRPDGQGSGVTGQPGAAPFGSIFSLLQNEKAVRKRSVRTVF